MHGDSGATVFKQVACKSINKIRSYSIQIMLGGGKGGKGPWGDAWGRGKGGRRTEGRTLVHRARQSYHTAPKAIGKSRTTKDPHFCAPSTCTTKARSSIMGRVHQDLCYSWRNGIGEGVWTGVRRSQLLDDKRETTSARARTTPHRHLSQTICLSEAAQPCPPVSPGEFVPLDVRLTALSLAEAVGGCTGTGCNVTEGTVGGDRGDEVAGGAADTPRSFCAMFGTSRGADVQYYKSRSCQSVELCSKYERSSSKTQHKANGVKRWRRVRRCPMRQYVFFITSAVVRRAMASRRWHRRHQLRSCRDHLVAALRTVPGRANKEQRRPKKQERALTSGNASRNRFCWIFHAWLREA